MLNLFPIQWLSLLAHFILRIITAGVLFHLAGRHFRFRQELSGTLNWSWFPFGRISLWLLVATEVITGLSLLLGLFTQVGALMLIIYGVKLFVIGSLNPHPALPNRVTCLLFCGIGLSLFITGAGAFAFDLPI